MPLSNLIDDYTTLDFSSLNAALKAFAQRRFPTAKWTDFNDSNFGTFLTELMAVLGEMLAYNQNARFLETIAVLARREGNFISLAKSFGFNFKGASAGTATLRIYKMTDPSTPYSFPISSHQQFGASDGTVFQPVVSQNVSSGALLLDPEYGYYFEIEVISGLEIYNEVMGTSDGQPSQYFDLSTNPLIEGTLTILVGATQYTEVSSFVEYEASDKVFVRTINESGGTRITFGDGVYGLIPANGSEIKATYKVGTGTDAQLPPQSITEILGTSDGTEVSGYLQGASCTNLAAVSGAGPRQTLENAKASLPGAIAANNRGVSLEDYASLVLQGVPGVVKASAMAGRYNGTASTILILTVPQGFGPVTPSLYNQIIIVLRGKKSAGRRPVPVSAVYATLEVSLDAFVRSNNSSGGAAQAVKDLLLTLFSSENIDFAAQFPIQTIYDEVTGAAIPSISRIFVRRFTITPYLGRYITFGTTGDGVAVGLKVNRLLSQRREWNIRVVTPQAPFSCRQFEIRQRQMGQIAYISDTTITDEQGNYDTGGLVGWDLVVRPLEGTTPIPILSNTQNSLTVAGGLLLLGGPDEPYVAEKLESTRGKILTASITASSSLATVSVASVADWAVGDPVIVVTGAGAEITRTTVASVGVLSLTLATSVTVNAGDKIHYLWRSGDGALEFALPDGDTAWAIGDELYADTYPEAGDLKLRPENYVTFGEANLVINTVGGIK